MKLQDEKVIIESQTTTKVEVPAYCRSMSGTFFYKRLNSERCIQISSYTNSIQVNHTSIMLHGGFIEIDRAEFESKYDLISLNLQTLAYTESSETVETILNPKK